MNAIGIRVEPQKIHYTIIINEGSEKSYVVETLNFPKALENDIPRQLSFIRTTIISIISEYGVGIAGLRTAEGNARSTNSFRLNIEGVVQELFSDSEIKDYFTGTLRSIASRLNQEVSVVSECLNGRNIYEISDWLKLNKNKRESFLAALAISKVYEEEIKDD